jgi:hypothetical protein
MRYTDRVNNLAVVYPELTRVWIKTGDPKLPLKGLWINEAKLHRFASDSCVARRENETAELAEDHLVVAA